MWLTFRERVVFALMESIRLVCENLRFAFVSLMCYKVMINSVCNLLFYRHYLLFMSYLTFMKDTVKNK